MADAGEQGESRARTVASAGGAAIGLPFSPKRSRARRRLVVLGCVVAALVGGWWIITRSFVTRWVLMSQISSRVGAPLEASSVTLRFDGTVDIRGARLVSEGVSGEARSFVSAQIITCQTKWWEFWRKGGPQVREIDVTGLVLRISQSAKDNSANIPTFADTGGGEVVLPLIRVLDGRIEVGEHDLPGGYRVLRSLAVTGDLLPEPATRSYTFALRQVGDVRSGSPLLLAGGWNAKRLEAKLTGLTLDEIDGGSVPESARDLVGVMSLRGEMPAATFAYTFPTPGATSEERLRSIEATIELVDVGVTLPFEGKSAVPGASKRPRMNHVGGRLSVLGGKAVATLKGRIEDLPYTVDLKWNGVSINSPFECVLVSSGFELKERPRLSPFLPDRVHEKLAMFSSPTGTLDTRVVVTRAKAGEDPKVNGTIEFRDGSASFVRFPYRFGAMSGLFEFDDTSLQIKRVDGTAPSGATIHVSGVISPLDEYAKVSLDFDMRNVPVDSTLEDGLGPRRRKIIDTLFCREKYDELLAKGMIRAPEDEAATKTGVPAFALGGRGNVKMKLESAYGKDMPWVQLIDIEIPRAGLLPRKFPVAVVAQDVKLRIDDTVLSVVGGRFATVRGGDATVTAKADFSSTGDGGDTEIAISARGIPFDEILLNAIPARDRPLDSDAAAKGEKPRTLGEALSAMRLIGAGDAEVKINDKDGGETTFSAAVKWKDAVSLPGVAAPGRVKLGAMAGDLFVDDNALKLALSGDISPSQVETANTPTGRFEVETRAAFAADAVERFSTDIHLRHTDASLALDDVVAAFSPETARILGDLRDKYMPSGIVDVVTSLKGRERGPLEISVTGTLPQGFGFRYTPEHAGNTPVAIKLGPATGSVLLSGSDDLWLSFASIHGPLTIDNTDGGVLSLDGSLGLGEPKVAGTTDQSKPERLKVNVAGARFESPLTRLVVHDRTGKQFAAFYDDRKPRGEFGLAMTLARREREWFVEGTLAPTSLAVAAEGTDVASQVASGVVRFKNREGTFEKLSLSNPEWSGALDGGWNILPDGSAAINLAIDARSHGFPGSLRSLLPNTVRTYASDLKLGASGDANFQGISIGLIYPPGEGVEPAVTAAGMIRFTGVSADLGVDVAKANGVVEFTSGVSTSGASTFQLSGTLTEGDLAGVRVANVKALVLRGATPGQTLVPHISADCHGGRIAGEASLRPLDPTKPDGRKAFETRIDLSGIELEGVLADLKNDGTRNQHTTAQSALLEGNVTLGGVVGDASSRRGRGQLVAGGGEVLSFPLLLPMIQVSNFQIPTGEKLDTARASFLISGQTIAIDRISVFSPEIELRGFGTIAWPDLSLDLVFNSRAAHRVPLVTTVIESIRNEFVTTRVKGTAKDPKVSITPFHSATSAMGSLFGSDRDRDKWMNEMERENVRSTDRPRVVSPLEASAPVR